MIRLIVFVSSSSFVGVTNGDVYATNRRSVHLRFNKLHL
ncbi:hypothetical protein AALP_AAs47827U000100 [Arabis alpina]|uniref:Uncharacterized protein n=1 Tax=Arabis alpina TaxID=50452 RepID=A0A087G170_ARAAL|nr:hypothetical protein AALP_AAs47827U000100 [Arabis alpina]